MIHDTLCLSYRFNTARFCLYVICKMGHHEGRLLGPKMRNMALIAGLHDRFNREAVLSIYSKCSMILVLVQCVKHHKFYILLYLLNFNLRINHYLF